jgi:haloalkane dehalogenase
MNALPPWLKVLYPFEGHIFPSAEGSLHYIDEGRGTPVVMLHGNPTWSFFYRDLILGLRDHHRCLVPDHLGCGLSEKPSSADYSLDGHIRRTIAWLDHCRLDQPFHLVVHDWGGAIGFGVARTMPERIRSLTVLNTAAFPFPSIPFRIAVCRWPLLGPVMVRGFNAFVNAATVMTTVQPLPQAVREGFRYPYRTWGDRVAVDAFVRDIPMRPSHRSWKTLKAIGESLTFWKERPVRIFWGMRDWCFHEGILREWERRLPAASVHRLPEAGHYLLEDAGEAVLPVLRAELEAPPGP